MPKAETITSAANPLLKDVRRAIARGGLTEEGWCVAETFHLLEEALRSDCEVKVVLAAESVRSAAEAHVQRPRRRRKWWCCRTTCSQSISGTEASQGVMALVRPPEWKLEQLFRGQTRWWWCSTACRIRATRARSCARRRRSARRACCS